MTIRATGLNGGFGYATYINAGNRQINGIRHLQIKRIGHLQHKGGAGVWFYFDYPMVVVDNDGSPIARNNGWNSFKLAFHDSWLKCFKNVT
jgi:hypothetical protein